MSITLTATAQDAFGAVVGTAANPSKLRIALAGFGPQLPRIAGTSIIAKPGPIYLESTSGSFSTPILGNDVITPSGTYYDIALLDGRGNVLQAAAYQLIGSGTQDLSNLAPYLNPGYSLPQGYITVPAASGALALSPNGWSSDVTFDITLAANVTSSTIGGLTRGQRVQFLFRQPGAHTFVWPANVKNPPLINSAANSVSTSDFIVDAAGNLYPSNGWS